VPGSEGLDSGSVRSESEMEKKQGESEDMRMVLLS
jgi:hypothetical protein